MRLCKECVIAEFNEGHWNDHSYSKTAKWSLSLCERCDSQDAVDTVYCNCKDLDVAQHDVRADLAGPGGNPRLTCFTPECGGATLLSYRGMKQTEHDEAVAKFLRIHACSEDQITDESGDSMQIIFT